MKFRNIPPSHVFKFLLMKVYLCGNPFAIEPVDYTFCENKKCNILIGGINMPIVILGDKFMQIYYTHFE